MFLSSAGTFQHDSTFGPAGYFLIILPPLSAHDCNITTLPPLKQDPLIWLRGVNEVGPDAIAENIAARGAQFADQIQRKVDDENIDNILSKKFKPLTLAQSWEAWK